MRTSAVVALWWNRGLLNHTVEPLKSLAVGSAQPSDQTALTTLHKSKVPAGGEQGNGVERAEWMYYIWCRKASSIWMGKNLIENRQRLIGETQTRIFEDTTVCAACFLQVELWLWGHLSRTVTATVRTCFNCWVYHSPFFDIYRWWQDTPIIWRTKPAKILNV